MRLWDAEGRPVPVVHIERHCALPTCDERFVAKAEGQRTCSWKCAATLAMVEESRGGLPLSVVR
jgi:hypothetical protein